MNTRNYRSHDIIELSLCLAAYVVILTFALGGCSEARAATRIVCRSAVCNPVVQHVQAAYTPQVYYQVAPLVQQQAVSTQAFRQSDEYQEYQYLKGYYAAKQETVQQQTTPATEQLPSGAHPAVDEPQPAAPVTKEFAAKYPTIAAKCARCHSGDNPEGDLFLNGSVPLNGTVGADRRDAIVRMIVHGDMPKGGQLTPEEIGSILNELYQEE